MIIQQPRKLPTHFSEMIRDIFQSRALRNPNYSLRAFSRDLGITSGHLSDLLNQKVGLSKEKAEALVKNFKLGQEDEKLFLHLVAGGKTPENPIKFDSSYVNLNDDYYKVLTEWSYFALVELVRVKDFQNNDEWIAKRLSIPKHEVRGIIERLIRVELLEEKENELIQTYDYFVSPSGTPLDAAKKFHKQVLAKAIIAVDEQEIQERDFTSGFLRVRKNDLPAIGQKIKAFRRELATFAEGGDNHDSVYAFSVQFFRADFEKDL